MIAISALMQSQYTAVLNYRSETDDHDREGGQQLQVRHERPQEGEVEMEETDDDDVTMGREY